MSAELVVEGRGWDGMSGAAELVMMEDIKYE